MGNHHGNRCHVTRSRSPGSLPLSFLFFFALPLQKIRKDGERRWMKGKTVEEFGDEGKNKEEEEEEAAGRFRIILAER